MNYGLYNECVVMEVKQGAPITSWIFVLIHLQRKPSVGLSKNYGSSDVYDMGLVRNIRKPKSNLIMAYLEMVLRLL